MVNKILKIASLNSCVAHQIAECLHPMVPYFSCLFASHSCSVNAMHREGIRKCQLRSNVTHFPLTFMSFPFSFFPNTFHFFFPFFPLRFAEDSHVSSSCWDAGLPQITSSSARWQNSNCFWELTSSPRHDRRLRMIWNVKPAMNISCHFCS